MRDRALKRSVRPTQTVLGVWYRGRTRAVDRALTDFGAEESFGRAAKRFEEHYGYEVGRTSVLRIVESYAKEAESYVAERLSKMDTAYQERLKQRPGVAAMLVEMDGCEIRTGTMKRKETREKTAIRKLPKKERVEAWRDVRLGLVRPMESVDKTYVGGMKSYDAIGDDLFSAAVGRGLSSNTKVVGVADGGNGIMEQLQSKFASFQFILDFAHFKEHLFETAEAMALQSDAKERWISRMIENCRTGHVAKSLKWLRSRRGRGKSSCLRLANYLQRFDKSVHYDAYQNAGYPIGSGEIESGHRVVPQRRLKLPGACWNPTNINPMLAIRILRENGWWHDFWKSRAA